MTKVEKWVWKETAEVIGVLGVIASLVFVAIQIRQNNELIESEARGTIVAMNSAVWTSVVVQPDIATFALKDRRGEELTDEEEFRLNAVWIRALYSSEYVFQEVPEAIPQITGMWRRAFAAYGSLRRTWYGTSTGSAMDGNDMFSSDFVAFVEENIINDTQRPLQ